MISELMKYVLIFLIFSNYLFAQENIDSLPSVSVGFIPIVYGLDDDNFPDSLFVSGIINEVSYGLSCGIFCGSGTLKVSITETNIIFPEYYIYIVIPCLHANNADIKVNKKVSLKVKKLFKENNDCYFEHILNTINSYGNPFYYYDSDLYGPIQF